MMMKQLFPLLCVLTAGWASPVESPQRHMLLSVVPTTQAQLELLKTAADTDYELDFWTHPRLNGFADVMVPWERFTELRQKWTAAGIQVQIKQESVEELIHTVEAENRRLREQRVIPRQGTTLLHDRYRSYDEFIDDIIKLRNEFPDLVRFDNNPDLPKTVEGQTIYYFEAGSNYENAPVIFLEVMIHAREWITGAANLYAFDRLLNDYGSDADATFLLDIFRFVVMPVANPDGYEYSRINSNTRLWRKNRRYVGSIFNCYGIDLNRNFDAYWLGSGTCSSITYPGLEANSEPETQAVQALFNKYRNNMKVYLAVHAYSQIMLLPWSYQSSSTAFNAYHRDVGQAMAGAMSAVYGRNFTYGTAAATLGYGAAGTSADWALLEMLATNGGESGILSLAYELRPQPGSGNNGFILDASHIIPAGNEYLASLVELGWQYRRSVKTKA